MGIPVWHQVPIKTIRKAIQDLVIQLSTWEPSGSLLLDISVKPPSALMHSSSTIQYGPGVISELKKAKIIQCSNWRHDTSDQGAAAYLFNRTTYGRKPKPRLKPSQEMPKARVVTSLLLRRQTRRPWESVVLEDLLNFLPEVYEIHYEPWRDWRRMEGRPTDTGKPRDTLLSTQLPAKVL